MDTRHTCVWVTLLGAMLLAAGAAQAQDDRGEQKHRRGIVIGEALTIRSAVLDEDRVILVGKPADYDQGKESYPVLFLLDGNDHFHHATALARSLASNGLMPGLLVVGIDNTVRIRDLTPPARDAQIIRDAPAHGGAERFRSFLARELMPWVDANFRTRPYRILVGHSLGGLFAIDSLLEQPDLFDAYIAISPSLQWDNRRTVERADALFQGRKQLDAALFMTVGNEGDALARGVGTFASLLEEQAPPGLAWHFEPLPLESHGSVPLRGLYRGLEFVFAGWTLRNPLDTYNRFGIEGIEHFFAKSDKTYGYARGVPQPVGATLARELLESGRLDEVAALLTRYGERMRPPAAVVERLAAAYRERGRIDRAIDLYRQALQINPKSEVSRRALTELGQDFGDLVR